MTAVAPDARLPGLHAEAGDPHTRLSRALADLEGAGWGLLFASQLALAQQLAAVLGPGTLRVDARLGLSREVFAAAGLAVATTDADWRGARAVWLLEPDERSLKRAKRAEVPVIVDATLAPGGGWLERGAGLLIYRDGASLSGFGDVTLAALFGAGEAPERRAPAPSDLSMAMVLRDLATLPLRLARAARTTATLLERFGGAAEAAGPTALLLSPDSAPDTHQPVGGVLAAARNVGAGTLITPGVQAAEAVLALLRGEQKHREEGSAQRPQADPPEARPAPSAQSPNSQAPSAQPQGGEAGPRAGAPVPESSGSESSLYGSSRPAQSVPTDFVPVSSAPAEPVPAEPVPEALNYVPEIVFSDSPPHREAEPRRSEAAQSGPEHRESEPPQEGDHGGRHDRDHGAPERGGHDDQDAEPAPPSVLPLRQGRRGTPQQGRRDRRDAQPSSAPQEEQAQSESRMPQPQPQPDAPDSSPAEVLQPEVVLTPDLPPAAGADPSEGLSDEQRAAYNRLRDWRNAEAKRQEISRFIIASNATLAEIARSAPSDETELRRVRGMGPERVRKYGAAILGTVQAD